MKKNSMYVAAVGHLKKSEMDRLGKKDLLNSDT